jgi:hypothetical protein
MSGHVHDPVLDRIAPTGAGTAPVLGYGLTMRGVLRAGIGLRTALGVALAADTVSIAVMELLDNTVMLAVPGALRAAGETRPGH